MKKELWGMPKSMKEKEPKSNVRKGCFHDEDHWCQNCINFGTLYGVKMKDNTISEGYIHTNLIS